MFERIEINQFQGLASEVSRVKPEQGVAQDILNLRIEKSDKLVSRNGTSFGVFDALRYDSAICLLGWKNNLGILGISELSVPGAKSDYSHFDVSKGMLDATKYIVYYIRQKEGLADPFKGVDTDDDGSDIPAGVDKTNYARFIFVPIEGVWKDREIPCTMILKDTIGGHTRATHQGEYKSNPKGIVNLYAPVRMLDVAIANEDEWISQYVNMNQYRYKLIVSDKINGDMFIKEINHPTEQEATPGLPPEFQVFPNCKQVFDIDIVVADYRFGNSQENDATVGVTHEMALYKYTAEKGWTKTTINPSEGKIGMIDTYGGSQKVDASESFILAKGVRERSLFSEIVYVNEVGLVWLPNESAYIRDLIVEENHVMAKEPYYRYTNEDIATEFTDISKPLEFEEEKYIDTETNKEITEKASGVYIWQDLELNYYPTVGKENITTLPFLKDIDKDWDKNTSGVPRLTNLADVDKYGRRVPVSGWAYKFVWDYGDGDYSVASTPLLVPDILWSATPDKDIEAVDYKRPLNLNEADIERSYETGSDPEDSVVPLTKTEKDYIYNLNNEEYYYFKDGKYSINPKLVDTLGELTDLGVNYFKLKEVLYGKQNHRFGIKNYKVVGKKIYDDKGNIVDLDPGPTNHEYGDITTAITVEAPDKGIRIETPVIESVYLYDATSEENEHNTKHLEVWAPFNNYDEKGNVDENLFASTGGLVIHCFPDGNKGFTVNTLFDIEGNLRLAPGCSRILAEPLRLNVQIFKVRVEPYGGNIRSNTGKTYNVSGIVLTDRFDFLEKDCTLQIVADWGGIKIEETGLSTDLWGRTLLRGTSNAADNLNYINGDIPSEVIERMVIEGKVELHLFDIKDRSKLFYYPDPTLPNILDYVPIIGISHDNYDAFKRVAVDYNSYYGTTKLWKVDQGRIDAYGQCYLVPQASKATNNVDVYAYLPGARFIGIEQLTSYFTSSSLFKSPRIGLKIPHTAVPQNAKRLLIFRTRATMDNNYSPENYGLVDTVTIERVKGAGITSAVDVHESRVTNGIGNNTPYTPDYIMCDGTTDNMLGIYYFDDVLDDAVDFSSSPNDYDGIYYPVKSRFNAVVNETMFYANFDETYQPLSPREDIKSSACKLVPLYQTPITNYQIIKADEGLSMLPYGYKYVFVDESGVRSREAMIRIVPLSILEYPESKVKNKFIVALYLMPHPYNASIKSLEIYRAEQPLPWKPVISYKYIGKIELEDDALGIFVDKGQVGTELLGYCGPTEITYESGVRWAEPYQPNWIKAENFTEVASGDGDQITGLEVQYGNLTVFKENSIHRLTVQAETPPISRTDIISQNIGCIAPNSLINVNNNLYFLSNQGFLLYDNNTWTPVDTMYHTELAEIMKNLESVRDISAGYNQVHNEIYLNLPYVNKVEKIGNVYGWQLFTGTTGNPALVSVNDLVIHDENIYYIQSDVYEEMQFGNEIDKGRNNLKRTKGNVYVHNIDKKYVTKYAYPMTVASEDIFEEIQMVQSVNDKAFYSLATRGEQAVKIYYNDSDGTMRSADILPKYYNLSKNAKSYSDYLAMIYKETPSDNYKWIFRMRRNSASTPVAADRERLLMTLEKTPHHSYDVIYDPDSSMKFTNSIINTRNNSGDWRRPAYLDSGMDYNNTIINPQPHNRPTGIKTYYHTVIQDLGASTLIKRLRKLLVHYYTHGEIRIIINSLPYDAVMGRYMHTNDFTNDDEIGYRNSEEVYNFPPTVDSPNLSTLTVLHGTEKNILEMVPRTYEEQIELPFAYKEDIDDLAKPLAYSIEIYGENNTLLNSIVAHIRPIWKYLA